MLNFDEAKVLQDQKNGIGLIPQAEAIVDRICQRGYSNIFYIGIGGTVLYAGQMMHIVKQLGATVPFYLENAADFCLEGNPFLNKDSVVVIESVSGDTKEVVEAMKKVHQIGAEIIGYIEKKGSPLYDICDNIINTTGAAYYFWYTVTLRFLKNAGQFDAYDKFFSEIVNLPENVVRIYKDADEDAKAYAEKYCDEPLTYLVGSGNLEDWATCHGMCIMEEMQWMRTRPVSAANFFHGTLEVIERDTPVILIKGEDKTRPEMDRVENFVNRISAKVIVFDTKKFKLNGIRDEFRWILAPIVMRSAFQRVNVHLEYCRRHPLEIRRYYRRLDY
ncbi:SIS domain-containing protein [Caproiciproducens galactitolivorans]|uniref:SIS domain-containing protein n=1 Tax=Caproiciproducens galactitolivorans TaxID=642589 RepID=A0ABT4BUZ5_9FIRM|nr:SIS domain-containing protein [Caproiciproducens galactitolivorans]MCY1714704.1 SIS domain-containing protein [Caproiciproducens galactitolivorans]